MYLDCSTKADKRLELVDQFNSSDKYKVFIVDRKNNNANRKKSIET
ncbi:hypothetical protein [Clostridium sp.]|nr:hypothetical protein [Clostridium sp.]MDR3595535.1 hypothetical protein [Clostridium sp.]